MELYQLAQRGSPEALSALVRQHMPLVWALAGRFSRSEDAFQQGCLGLVTAIRRYREDSGLRFSTYAVPVILGEIRHAFSRNLGWRARKKLNLARRCEEEYLRQRGRAPTAHQIAAAAGIPPEELMLLIERDRGPQYDESGALLSSLPDPRGDDWLLRILIRDILSRMRREESWLIRQRFIIGRSQAHIARMLRITQSTASRREKAARMHFRAAWLEGDQS